MDVRTANWGLIGAAALQGMASAAIWYLPWRFDVGALRDAREVLSAGAFGIILAQVSLIAVWTAVGPARLPLRAASALLGLGMVYLAGYSFFFRINEDPALDLAVLLAFSMVLAWCQVLCVVMGLVWGFKLKVVSPLADQDQPAHSQFHLWHLLIVITAAAVLLAAARRLTSSFSTDMPIADPSIWLWLMLILLVIVTFVVISSLVAMAARIAPRWPVRLTIAGLCIVCVFTALCEWLVISLIDSPSTSTAYHVVTNLAAYVWTALTLAMVPLKAAVADEASRTL